MEAPWRPDRSGDETDEQVDYATLTYQVTGRVARITFNRPEQGNAITRDTPVDLAHAVERADLDPRVHVILLSGRGKGFCGGYDLAAFAEDLSQRRVATRAARVLDPAVQMANHDPAGTWDPMVDYAMMSRFNRGFASLLHANKPTVAKVHGFCVAGGTDIALVRRPDRDRRRRQDRLPADPGLGRAGRRHVGAPARRPAGQAAAAHRRLPLRHRGGRVGTGDRGARHPSSSTSAPRSWCSGSRRCRSTS